MDKNIKDFHERKINTMYFHDENGNRIARLSRDITPSNIECLYLNAVDIDNGEEKTYDWYPGLWHNPNKKTAKDPNNPKNTGGKKSYSILMTEELMNFRKTLHEKNINNVEEIIGCVLVLTEYMQWNTGKLIKKKRSRKPLQYNDMVEIFGYSKPKLNNIINILKKNDLLIYTNEGYFLSSKYIKKGKSPNKKEVIE